MRTNFAEVESDNHNTPKLKLVLDNSCIPANNFIGTF
jgi:hypothetical protein